ncbi:MAG: hypothetical protein NTV98_05030 [Candidatus Roizmanbacteria bacterium]|nr:hypothetical protein [Candidatus Roizmanbacteria bacterium]
MLQLEESHSSLHALCVRPNIQFDSQRDGETVLLSLRAHPITLGPAVFNSLVFFILIFFLNFIVSQFISGISILYINIFFIFFVFVYLWMQIVNWYFNVGLITNMQIIDVDFNILTFKEITRTELTHVEDVTVKTSGFISGIFDFGSIYVQTAGSEINSEFIMVPHPARAAKIIEDILKQYGNS